LLLTRWLNYIGFRIEDADAKLLLAVHVLLTDSSPQLTFSTYTDFLQPSRNFSMTRTLARNVLIALFCLFTLRGINAVAQTGQYPAAALSGLQWRDVGPMRGGRTFAVAGVATQPDTFYMGSVGGGVWKTENSGRTWAPISDEGIPIGSIGAIAVAPSDPNVVYVGTGEPDIRNQHSYGIGMYKSVNAGKTWTHIGLADSEHIGRIVVDPANPDRLYVAVLGHIYDANAERGVYRSTDGGKSWNKVLFNVSDPNDVGAIDIAIDPKNAHVLYASLWATRRPPWAVYTPSYMPGSGLYKSADGGDHWTQLHGGFPDDPFVGKIGIAVAPSNPNRLWAVVDDIGAATATMPGASAKPAAADAPKPTGGVYVSDDAGKSWRLVNAEKRLWGRGWYFEGVTVDPTNPDTVYVINTATYRSTDAGKTFVPVKAAPGGDDYHQLWINPSDPKRMVLSSDQGTVVSVDGAKTWSTWYNQPTAEIYRVAADNRFPYWLDGAQQDSGAVGVATWSRFGVLDYRSWEPLCQAGESNTVVPDPKDPTELYGGGAGRCNQALNVQQPLGKMPPDDPTDPMRKTWTLPEVFSPADQALYSSDQFVFRTRDHGVTWVKISADLTRIHPEVPKTLDAVTAKDIDEVMTDRFGVVFTISPSPLDAKTVWVGTDDGLIWKTTDDGAHWNDLTPAALTAWSKVSQVEAGHFDPGTAYASVDRHRLGDRAAYIYRTHDGGKTWVKIADGIPIGAFVNSVKEDPKMKGLLYAATELRVYVSFDDGDRWQPLQLNMPATSVRDLVVHEDDLDIATHGRGFWVLDQMTALRQLAGSGAAIVSSPAYLFKPGTSLALVPGAEDGTPLPPEEPQEKNPPSGVLAYYWLKNAPTTPLTLELLDSKGEIVACAASDAPVKPVDTERIDVQALWKEPAQPPAAFAGMHRFALNILQRRGEEPGGGLTEPPPHDACSESQPPPPPARKPGETRQSRVALDPGQYMVRLVVDGKTYNQPAEVAPDPRGAKPYNAEDNPE
jgi:photosystem II stability/assembly factor-like uncharacterized protein